MIKLSNASIENSEFDDVSLADSRFNDVNLKRTVFNDIDFNKSVFTDVSLKNVQISNANLKGMTIEGILVSDLFAAYELSVQNNASMSDDDSQAVSGVSRNRSDSDS